MKRNLFVPGTRVGLYAWSLAVGILLSVSANAQTNYLKNGDFNLPLGPTNWTVKYVYGDDEDFEIKDRTGISSRYENSSNNDKGGHLRPNTPKPLVHACFSQTVTNLSPGHPYIIGGWMKWVGPEEFGNAVDRYRVYFEAIGGQGTARTPDLTTNVISGYFNLTNTPDANQKIEVRLNLHLFQYFIYDKLPFCNAYFDDFSLTE